jgi:predicted ester cyclase
MFISLWALFSELRAESSSAACPVTTQVESTAIARAWHDDVINRRNPTMLSDIVGSEVVHHAAGGYPKIMNAEGIAAMMGDFLAAFPDLLITFDQFIAKDDFVVERYTASGTHQGPLGDLQATNRTATWTGINIFRIACRRIVEVWSEVDAEGRKRQLILPVTPQADKFRWHRSSWLCLRAESAVDPSFPPKCETEQFRERCQYFIFLRSKNRPTAPRHHWLQHLAPRRLTLFPPSIEFEP